jgi:solute carrier family 25 oxoglutarate transporter 11
MSSGLLYSLVTMPMETAKNRMAFQRADASGKMTYTGTIQTVSLIATKEGPLKVLFFGFIFYSFHV